MLVDEGLSSRERRGQGSVDLVDRLVGFSTVAGSSPFAKAGRQAQALGNSRSHEAVEFRHPISKESIQGPIEGVIVELIGGNTG